MKKLFLIICLVLGFANVTSCAKPVEEEDTVVYEEVGQEPSYNEITDFSSYKTFYIDPSIGDDSFTGIDMNSPKKTTSSIPNIINEYSKNYPVRILLKKGETFPGNIVLGGYTATSDKPFILSSYGQGNDYPKIEGVFSGDLVSNAIITVQEENTRIDGLEVTGKDCTRGIYVKSRVRGIFKNIIIRNCYVHDINWNWTYDTKPDKTNPSTIDVESVTPYTPSNGSTNRYRRLYGGIEVFNGTTSGTDSRAIGPAIYDNLFIENNRIENVSHVAINFYNYWANRAGIGYGYNKYVPTNESLRNFDTGVGLFFYTNIVIRNNFTNCIGGDSIILDGGENFYITNNTSYKASYLGRTSCFNAGIWCHNCKNGYMMYNEAAYTYLQNGAGDGEGFDIDIACENVKVYYNYCHHNQGGGILLCNNSSKVISYDENGSITDLGEFDTNGLWRNNYLKNNVFAYNGLNTNKNRSSFITLARKCDDFIADNNTIIVSDISKQHIINCEDTVVSENHSYKNNLFYCESSSTKPIIALSTLKNPVFDSNLYFNIEDGNELANEFIKSSDINANIPESFEMNLPSSFDGFENSFNFYPNSEYEFTNILDTQLKFDIAGSSTERKRYIGAICK